MAEVIPMRNRFPAVAFALALLVASAAAAQQDEIEQAGLYAPSVWNLEPGLHATELPADEFIDYACGTNGGPPSLPLTGWADYAECQPEADTGYYEVFFQYDDEPEFWARALRIPTKILLYQYTSAYAIPIIVSGLFDSDGFLMGFRMVTDPRMEPAIREKASDLAGFLMARYDAAEWICEDIPRIDGEREFKGVFIKAGCVHQDPVAGLDIVLELHHFRKAGQFAINPADGLPMEGQFESMTRFEAVLINPLPNREARIAVPAERGPTERDLLIRRAMDCPGCDLSGANLKRANLAGANLAGANLSGANLHGANLAGANLVGANLENANINRADVKRADLRGANLTEAMIFESRFDGADLSGARLQGAFGGKVQMIGANVSNANLSLMDLREARLNDANFSGSNINQSNLDDAQLTRSNFAGASIILTSMHRTSLVAANLTGADVRATDLFGANLRGADLTEADFSRSRLTNVNLSDAQITGAMFVDALLPEGFEPE